MKVDIESSSVTLNATEVTGDRCSLIFVRGKKKYGFDLTIKGTVKGEYNGQQVDATFKIPEIDETSFHDNDYIFKLKGVPKGTKRKIKAAIQPEIQKRIGTFIEEMKQQ